MKDKSAKALDLDEYKWDIRVRPMTMDDFDNLVAMQQRCFPGMSTWTRDQIQSQISLFPQGQVCVEVDGQLAASSCSLILKYDPAMEWHNWQVVADSGYIRNHNPQGDTLYGIEIMVAPEFRGMKLARRLYDARKEVCRERNLARIIIGGRIPGYGQYADQMTAREYVEQVSEKAIYDPVLTAQIANGFALQGLIPNYFPSDDASRGYATFLEWRNLDYQPGRKRRFRPAHDLIRLCVVQYQMRTVASFEDFARASEFFIDVASDYKGDFILFPELFTTQLLSCVEGQRPGTGGAAAFGVHTTVPGLLRRTGGQVQRERGCRLTLRGRRGNAVQHFVSLRPRWFDR